MLSQRLPRRILFDRLVLAWQLSGDRLGNPYTQLTEPYVYYWLRETVRVTSPVRLLYPRKLTFEHPKRWLRKIELLHLPIHNTKPSNGGINHVMGSYGHLDFEAFVC